MDRMTEVLGRFDSLMEAASPVYKRGVSKDEVAPGLAIEAIKTLALVEISLNLQRIADALDRGSTRE